VPAHVSLPPRHHRLNWRQSKDEKYIKNPEMIIKRVRRKVHTMEKKCDMPWISSRNEKRTPRSEPRCGT